MEATFVVYSFRRTLNHVRKFFGKINTSMSVRKVVPTLTSKSAEIYLLMAGAKKLMTRGLSWFRPGPYVQ
jgi:hypothetical protein